MAITSVDAARARIPDHLLIIPRELQEFLNALSGNIADWTLKTLLKVMKGAFEVSDLPIILLVWPDLKGFDSHLKDFSGGYVFGTKKKGAVQASVVFKNNKMEVLDDEIPDWDVKILFKDEPSFWKFILSGGNDILDSILENDVEVYGNLNYLYKFGYMAKDLVKRLNLDIGFSA